MLNDYFLKYKALNSDFTIDPKNGNPVAYQGDDSECKVTLVNTGLNSMTGGRVKRLQEFIGNETFLLTYGDGLSDINIDKLIEFHRNHGKMVTISAVHPIARFGELTLQGESVVSFNEKPQTKQGWINGGYFVIEPDFFDLVIIDECHQFLSNKKNTSKSLDRLVECFCLVVAALSHV